MHDSPDDEHSEHEARAEECERELGALLDKYEQAHLRRAVSRIFTSDEVKNAEELWRKEFGFPDNSDDEEAGSGATPAPSDSQEGDDEPDHNNPRGCA